jgi:dihydrofolate reductase
MRRSKRLWRCKNEVNFRLIRIHGYGFWNSLLGNPANTRYTRKNAKEFLASADRQCVNQLVCVGEITVKINLIWAQAHHRVIGLNGTMPWHLPEDLAHFKRTTLGCPVIMGRKTWDSLPLKFRPLPGRTNLVLTRQADWHEDGVLQARSLHDAIALLGQMIPQPATVWVIGGAQIYAQALPLATKVVVTEIDADYTGDAFAPQLDAAWREVLRESHLSSTGLAFSFVTYTRI